MSTITSVSNDYIIQPNTMQKENDPLTLGSEDFMKLMLTQMQNQNPMEPADQTAMISQMAEFSALEQMQSMNSSINTMYAFGLMGKEVSVNNGDGTMTTGIVDSVTMKNGTNYIEIGGIQYDTVLVLSAAEPSIEDEEAEVEEPEVEPYPETDGDA